MSVKQPLKLQTNLIAVALPLTMLYVLVSTTLMNKLGLASGLVRSTALVDVIAVILLVVAEPPALEKTAPLFGKNRVLRNAKWLSIAICMLQLFVKVFATVVLLYIQHNIN